jgi:hypothetical protein
MLNKWGSAAVSAQVSFAITNAHLQLASCAGACIVLTHCQRTMAIAHSQGCAINREWTRRGCYMPVIHGTVLSLCRMWNMTDGVMDIYIYIGWFCVIKCKAVKCTVIGPLWK